MLRNYIPTFNKIFSGRQPCEVVRVLQHSRYCFFLQLRGATDDLVKPNLIYRCPAVWCVDLRSAWTRNGMRAPLVSGLSQKIIAPGLAVTGCIEHWSILTAVMYHLIWGQPLCWSFWDIVTFCSFFHQPVHVGSCPVHVGSCPVQSVCFFEVDFMFCV